MKVAGWLGIMLWLASACAVAGSFSVAPTRVEFDAGRRTAVISLRNVGDAPLTVQATLVDWTQPAGEDQHAPTRDLLATPPVFTIAPQGEQLVRIALRRAPDGTRELPYRIFFQEVPAAPQPGSNTLNIALRVGVPVFVHPLQSAATTSLNWHAVRLDTDEIEVVAENPGGTHVQVTGFEVKVGDAPGIPVSAVRYVLPGNRVAWKVAVPVDADLATLRVAGHSDQGDFTATVAVR